MGVGVHVCAWVGGCACVCACVCVCMCVCVHEVGGVGGGREGDSLCVWSIKIDNMYLSSGRAVNSTSVVCVFVIVKCIVKGFNCQLTPAKVSASQNQKTC